MTTEEEREWAKENADLGERLAMMTAAARAAVAQRDAARVTADLAIELAKLRRVAPMERNPDELTKWDNHSRDSLLSHLVCAMVNWSYALDDADELVAERDALRARVAELEAAWPRCPREDCGPYTSRGLQCPECPGPVPGKERT